MTVTRFVLPEQMPYHFGATFAASPQSHRRFNDNLKEITKRIVSYRSRRGDGPLFCFSGHVRIWLETSASETTSKNISHERNLVWVFCITKNKFAPPISIRSYLSNNTPTQRNIGKNRYILNRLIYAVNGLNFTDFRLIFKRFTNELPTW